eukprot:TRINITY_DN590_c0_g1_i3.p1 TRINITY_DN590_c0_g1~~TRINITY_DN590_c0_g1_i3.p1  ORF type:complete len:744 (-),score=147.37 TRINITY_DN590_c0_g1_i3:131-2182(-)
MAPNVRNNLSYLNISKNRLKCIPDCIYWCINITELYANGNEIEELSNQILEFYQLRVLSLSGNKLSRLPHNMHKLNELRCFNVDDNQLMTLPNTVGKMEYLTEFRYLPNPFIDDYYKNCEDLYDLLKYLKKQPIPPIYKKDYAEYRAAAKAVNSALTPDERLTKGLLFYKEGKEAVVEFMKKEHSDEILSFYYELKQFKDRFNSTITIHNQTIIDECSRIYETYIADTAENQLNLSSECMASLKKSFEDTFVFPKGINQFVFDDAYGEAFDLMVRDTFQRFRLSKNGKMVVEMYENFTRRVAKHQKRAKEKAKANNGFEDADQDWASFLTNVEKKSSSQSRSSLVDSQSSVPPRSATAGSTSFRGVKVDNSEGSGSDAGGPSISSARLQNVSRSNSLPQSRMTKRSSNINLLSGRSNSRTSDSNKDTEDEDPSDPKNSASPRKVKGKVVMGLKKGSVPDGGSEPDKASEDSNGSKLPLLNLGDTGKNAKPVYMFGYSGVGRTALLARYVKDSFSSTSTTQSEEKSPVLGTENVEFQLVSPVLTADGFSLSANQTVSTPSKKSAFGSAFKGKKTKKTKGHQLQGIEDAFGFILVYDITDLESFNKLKAFWEEVKGSVGRIPAILVGNHLDGADSKRKVSNSLAFQFALDNTFFFKEVSAKTGENCDLVATVIKPMIQHRAMFGL